MEVLYIIVPCYNEEEILEDSSKKLKIKMKKLIKDKIISDESKIIFVNDGSTDNTLKIIKELNSKDKIFNCINLSKNEGHQKALLAGLLYSKEFCDFSISIDADLQDDINAIDLMIKKYNEGNEIVYGVRDSRSTDTFLKRKSATTFYKILNKMGAKIIFNHADFRLLSKKVMMELSKYRECNLFLRGIIPMIGYDSSIVYYDRKKRMSGKSKYSLKKMINLALDGITSLTITPLRFILYFGLFTSIISLLSIIISIILMLNKNGINFYIITFEVLMLFLNLNIFFLGIIGEYLGKSYLEVKDRPKYIISDIIK